MKTNLALLYAIISVELDKAEAKSDLASLFNAIDESLGINWGSDLDQYLND